MEILKNGILETNTNNKYPSRLITRIVTVAPDPAMVIMEDKLEEQRKISLKKFKAAVPPQVLQKRPLVFASALAHEVRNPLTNINLAAELIVSGTLDEEQKLFVEIIKRGVARINNLLTDFLTSHKNKEAHSETCSVNDLLDEVLDTIKDRILLKNVTVRKLYSSIDHQILINKEEIKLALINVIINGIEAMPLKNGILKLATRISDDKCIIEVEDNGTGISEKDLKNIFAPFFTNKPGGMGIGLSTTLDILLSNCATLDVQSEEGTGSRFTLFFDKMGRSDKISS
jgi:signal transduction histidine kinase